MRQLLTAAGKIAYQREEARERLWRATGANAYSGVNEALRESLCAITGRTGAVPYEELFAILEACGLQDVGGHAVEALAACICRYANGTPRDIRLRDCERHMTPLTAATNGFQS